MREGVHLDALAVDHVCEHNKRTEIEVRIRVKDGVFRVDWVLLLLRIYVEKDCITFLHADDGVEELLWSLYVSFTVLESAKSAAIRGGSTWVVSFGPWVIDKAAEGDQLLDDS